MATTRTPNLKLRKPGQGDTGWHVPINKNADLIDGLSVLREFSVAPAEFDANEQPKGLNYEVKGGTYIKLTGERATVADFGTRTAAANQTTYIWLRLDGTLGTSTTGWPTYANITGNENYFPMARVVAGGSDITQVIDDRFPSLLYGRGLPFGQLAVHVTRINTSNDGPTYYATEYDHYIDAYANTGDLEIVLYPPATRNNLVIVHGHGAGNYDVRVVSGKNPINQANANASALFRGPSTFAIFLADGEEGWSRITQNPVDMRLHLTVTAADLVGSTNDRLPEYGTYDYYRCDASAGPWTGELPLAINVKGQVYTLKKVDASGNAVTIAVRDNTDDLIEGQASHVLASQYDTLRIYSTGDAWEII